MCAPACVPALFPTFCLFFRFVFRFLVCFRFLFFVVYGFRFLFLFLFWWFVVFSSCLLVFFRVFLYFVFRSTPFRNGVWPYEVANSISIYIARHVGTVSCVNVHPAFFGRRFVVALDAPAHAPNCARSVVPALSGVISGAQVMVVFCLLNTGNSLRTRFAYIVCGRLSQRTQDTKQKHKKQEVTANNANKQKHERNCLLARSFDMAAL